MQQLEPHDRKCKGPCERELHWPTDFPKAGFYSDGAQRYRTDYCHRCWAFSNKQRAPLRASVKKRIKAVDEFLHNSTRGIGGDRS